ncbi:hypothetical protein niasHS_015177 [Heterodera schachtii]|uniref:Calponin-homology (CH) domain-containing protein n=1 Tax=Heterodera schachtii TaxID=97005 RepID=A0ABD2I2C5_HETSC
MNNSNHTQSVEVKLLKDDDWKLIQQNTFTRWVNQHLKKAPGSPKIENLATDFHDGILLIQLAEVLAQRNLVRFNRKPTMRTQKLDNISTVLNFFQKEEHIKIVNIDSSHIADHNLKLILGLMWTLILHYSLSQSIASTESVAGDEDGLGNGTDHQRHPSPRKSTSSSASEQQSPKKRLLAWIQERVPHLAVTNFTSDWTNGIVLGALFGFRFYGSFADFTYFSVDACLGSGAFAEWRQWNVDGNDALLYTHRAMQAAEDGLGVAKLMTPEELTNPNVDEKSVMTYLSQFPRARPLYSASTRAPLEQQDSEDTTLDDSNQSDIPVPAIQPFSFDEGPLGNVVEECQQLTLSQMDDDDNSGVTTALTCVTKTTTSYTIGQQNEADDEFPNEPSLPTDMENIPQQNHQLYNLMVCESDLNDGIAETAAEPTTDFDAVRMTYRHEELQYEPLVVVSDEETVALGTTAVRPQPGFRSLCRERSTDHIEAAAMVAVEGHGLQSFVPGQAAKFAVDASNTELACPKALFVGVVTSHGPADKVTVEHVGGGCYEVSYTVQDDTEALVFVKYGKNNVDGSPFSVRPMSFRNNHNDDAFLAEMRTDDVNYYRM